MDLAVPDELRPCPSPPCAADAAQDVVAPGEDAAGGSAATDIAPDRPVDAPPADAADVPARPDVPAAIDRPETDAPPDVRADAPVDGPLDTPAPLPADASRAIGAACNAAGDCASGFCVDGVCCQTACKEGCFACNLSGSIGGCAPVAAGDDPGDDCPRDDVSSCARDGTCNGIGACRLFPAGSVCEPMSCMGSAEASARTCDGLGTCRPATTKNCDPYLCAGAVCGTSCTGAAGCVSTSACAAGKCTGLLPSGGACTAGAQCVSSLCVDGVCCQTACAGACQSCNLAGSVGSCAPIAAGDDPGNECAPDAAATCMKDGACDGRGGCRLHAAGTSCAAPTCAASMAAAERTCNGAGVCQPAMSRTCAPYLCSGTACGTSCASATDCQPDHHCDVGVCKPKGGSGAACANGGQCTSGNCANGLCCDTACTGLCEACNLTGSAGTCAPIPAGADPDGECPTEDPTTCLRDGACDGARACRLYASGATCAAGTCSGGMESSARTCDGAGVCRAAVVRDCAPYACGATTCASMCVQQSDCPAATHFCDAGMCKPKLGNGNACTMGFQCSLGNCVDGVCCNAACTGSCEACDLAGSVGTCSPVPAGMDPAAECPTDAASTCMRDGACNGSGACRLYASGTACAAQVCAAGVETSARTCNGTGTCQAGTTRNCSPYVCQSATCGTACSGVTGCATGYYCDGVQCLPK